MMKLCYLTLLATLALSVGTAPAQYVPGLDTARLMPHGYAIPEGTTADIVLKMAPQAGVSYTLYHNEQATDQGQESTAGTDSLVWTVAETGVYTIVAQRGDCQQAAPGSCIVSVFPATTDAEASQPEVSPDTHQLTHLLENNASVNNETTANNTACTCGGPSIQPPTLDLCGQSSLAIVVQGGLVAGFYSLLRNGSPVRQINWEDCGMIIWEDINTPGTYTVQGPGGCPVSGTTEVVETNDCDDDGSNCGTGANIDWRVGDVESPPPYNLCQGTTVTLAADQESDYYQWYYLPGTDGGGEPDEPFVGGRSVEVRQSGTYILRTPDGCNQAYETSIPLFFNPNMGTVSLEGPSARCEGDATTQYVVSGNHVGYFQWDPRQLGEGHTTRQKAELN